MLNIGLQNYYNVIAFTVKCPQSPFQMLNIFKAVVLIEGEKGEI